MNQNPPKAPTLRQFREFVDSFPYSFKIWNFKGDELDLLIRALETQHVARVRAIPDPRMLSRHSRGAQDAEGVIIKWGSNHPHRGMSAGVDSTQPSRRHLAQASTLIDLAYAWSQMETALIAAEHGYQGFESDAWEVRFPQTNDLRYEALERRVGRPWDPDIPEIWRDAMDSDILKQWARRHGVGEIAEMTDREFSAALRIARLTRALQPREFDPKTRLRGFSLDEAHALWDVLHADAFIAAFLTAASLRPDAALMTPSAEDLLSHLSLSTSIDPVVVQAFLDFQTFDPDVHPDPAVAPLVRRGEQYLIPPILVTTSNFERNLLRCAALDNRIQGPIGDERGRRGAELVAKLMGLVPRVEVTSGLPVVRSGGAAAGDLDVVVVDEAAGIAAILEVKWPGPPDHIIEILRIERIIEEAQQKALELQRGVEGGHLAISKWPEGWPRYEAIRWTWGVVVNDHLSHSDEVRAHPIRPTTWQVLWHRPGRTLEETLNRAFLDVELPNEGADFERVWYSMPLGPYHVKIESVELLGTRGADSREVSELFKRFAGVE